MSRAVAQVSGAKTSCRGSLSTLSLLGLISVITRAELGARRRMPFDMISRNRVFSSASTSIADVSLYRLDDF